MKTAFALSVLTAAGVLLVSCASERPLVDELQPNALQVAQQHGASDLKCEAAGADILTKQALEEPVTTGWYEPPHRAQYTVSVSGCEKRATYSVVCDERGPRCVASTVQPAAAKQQELAQAMQPNALQVAQQHGASELSCPVATAKVLSSETLEEPVTTGWYEPPHRAQYTVGVSGCDKRASYLVVCDDRNKGCVAGTIQQGTRASQTLADEMRPTAVSTAQQRGSAQLECPSAAAEVVTEQTVQTPTTTGWYDPPHIAKYTVNVSGCEKRTSYAVTCDSWHTRCLVGTIESAAR
jgi:hypothetical protein